MTEQVIDIPQTQDTDKAQAERLKKKHNTKQVYKISVDGEGDTVFTCWLRKPSLAELSAALSMANRSGDEISANAMLFKTLFVEGDSIILEDEDLLFNALKNMGAIIEHRTSSIVKF